MSISILVKTIIIEHEKFGPFKFEIYETDGRYSADIQSRNGDGRWVIHKNGHGFKKALTLDDAQKSCERFIDILGK
ncbi:Uncharacterised protein [Raoultella planticola]|uniref:hypothetical protein n=1 Tax=Raoultella planticola TaxID=575 RepID=UPI0010E9E61E|nr:hypothetical protein [Raoultella planticola]VTM99757.1 Uncharacterised protein [Raoultella planticola]